MESPFYCSEYTRAHNGQLPGTMNPFSHALLLEYPLTFAPKAMGGAEIVPEIKQQVIAVEKIFKAMGGVKLLLIRNRQTVKKETSQFRLWYITEFGHTPRVSTLLQGDLPGMDPQAIVDLLTQGPTHEGDFPRYLVCTNGNRDKCCARFGFPIYRALAQTYADRPDTVWECSHVGGHRFAANVLTFPNALMYGNVLTEELPTLIQHTDAHQVWLARYRGEALLPKIGQIAAHHLRDTQQLLDIADIQAASLEQTTDLARVLLQTSKGAFEVDLSSYPIEVYNNCTDESSKTTSYWKVESVRQPA